MGDVRICRVHGSIDYYQPGFARRSLTGTKPRPRLDGNRSWAHCIIFLNRFTLLTWMLHIIIPNPRRLPFFRPRMMTSLNNISSSWMLETFYRQTSTQLPSQTLELISDGSRTCHKDGKTMVEEYNDSSIRTTIVRYTPMSHVITATVWWIKGKANQVQTEGRKGYNSNAFKI